MPFNVIGEWSQQSPRKSTIGLASFEGGQWFCNCSDPAILRVTRKPGLNQDKEFWRCPNINDGQCPFFLWVEHEAEAQDLVNAQKGPPQTPTRPPRHQPEVVDLVQAQAQADALANAQLETPFTKAKRKRVIIVDDDGADQVGDPVTDSRSSSQTMLAEEETPPRKTARVPAQSFVDRLMGLPTPESSAEKVTASRARQRQRDESPTPSRRRRGQETEVSKTVLGLIQGEKMELRTATEMQVVHEIELLVDVGEARAKRYEETIRMLAKRVDELEGLVKGMEKEA